MRRKLSVFSKMTWFAAVVMTASLTAGMICSAEEVPAESQTEEETRLAAASAPEIEKLTVTLEDNGSLTVSSHLAAEAEEVFVRRSDTENWSREVLFNGGKAEWEEAAIEEETETEADGEAAEETEPCTLLDLQLTVDGTAFFFFGIDPADGETALFGDAAAGSWTESADADDEADFYPVLGAADSYPVYALTPVYVRSLPDKSGEILKTLGIQDAVSVRGTSGDWLLLWMGDRYGFVNSSYVSADPAEAENARIQEDAARAAAEAAAAAAAAQAAAQQSRSSGSGGKKSSGSSGKTVVSTEDVASCDDGSHGTRYITYSDGSVSVVNY